MLTFFRKIRKALLDSGSAGKYMIYAIGEIALVVIGILIALQLNNWNGNRKTSNAELELYSSILDDLRSEYNGIETDIRFANLYDQLHKHIYNEINGKAQYDPELRYNYFYWFHRYDMFIKEKYSESLTLITNVSIHRELKSYMKQELYTQVAVDEWNENQLQQVRPYLTLHGINNSEVMFDEQANEFAPIINNMNLIDHAQLKEQYGTQELDQLLFNVRFKALWMAQNFKWLQDRNREFQIILSRELALTKLNGNFESVAPETIEELHLSGKTTEQIIEIITHEVENEIVYEFKEDEINSLGYDLMEEEKYNYALTVFKLNTELYPNQWNTYDSYGECLLEMGDIENGIKAYEKSLKLNPDNTYAKEVLDSLKVE